MRYPSGRFNVASSPKLSFSVNRWPLAKSAAGIRLRPSSCTSSSSRSPSRRKPPAAASADQRPGGADFRSAPALRRARATSRCAASARERPCTRPATAAIRAPDCESPAPCRVQSIAPVFLLQQRRVGGLRVVLLLRHDRPGCQSVQRLHQQVRAHRRQPPRPVRRRSPPARSPSPPSAACRRYRAPRRSAWW